MPAIIPLRRTWLASALNSTSSSVGFLPSSWFPLSHLGEASDAQNNQTCVVLMTTCTRPWGNCPVPFFLRSGYHLSSDRPYRSQQASQVIVSRHTATGTQGSTVQRLPRGHARSLHRTTQWRCADPIGFNFLASFPSNGEFSGKTRLNPVPFAAKEGRLKRNIAPSNKHRQS